MKGMECGSVPWTKKRSLWGSCWGLQVKKIQFLTTMLIKPSKSISFLSLIATSRFMPPQCLLVPKLIGIVFLKKKPHKFSALGNTSAMNFRQPCNICFLENLGSIFHGSYFSFTFPLSYFIFIFKLAQTSISLINTSMPGLESQRICKSLLWQMWLLRVRGGMSR